MLNELRKTVRELATAAKVLDGKLNEVDADAVPVLVQARALVLVEDLKTKLAKVTGSFAGYLPFNSANGQEGARRPSRG